MYLLGVNMDIFTDMLNWHAQLALSGWQEFELRRWVCLIFISICVAKQAWVRTSTFLLLVRSFLLLITNKVVLYSILRWTKVRDRLWNPFLSLFCEELWRIFFALIIRYFCLSPAYELPYSIGVIRLPILWTKALSVLDFYLASWSLSDMSSHD